jgi:hypothetical protein
MGSASIFSPDFGTRFLLSVDTEEEFEWGKGFARDTHGTTAVPAMRDGQAFFSEAGVAPLYFVDYPIACSDAATDILGPAFEAGQAQIGVHLHPWVTPPFSEQVNSRNSYAGNLPAAVERAKLVAVRDELASRFGKAPVAYRAGRYGIGPNTLQILAEEGFRCDSSVRSHFDYRDDGGPDFSRQDLHARWTGPRDSILELPLTSVMIGFARQLGCGAFRYAGKLPLARSLLARSGALERIAITPEGTPAALACEAIDVAQERGVRLISMSFHSPSLAPGYTPYVRNESDLAAFYRWFDIVFDHCARRGIAAASLDDVLADAEAMKLRVAA